MDAVTLAGAMGGILSQSAYNQYAAPFNVALFEAGCNTVNRAAMFCAQVGHESLGLRYMEELASGSAYEGRRDLGNTTKGDGVRFKGRGPIQLTGRANYGAFSRWCHDKGLVTSATYFVDNPSLVATPQWGFLAASWYWTVARASLNSYADAGNVVAATKAVNGGTNGLADRTSRWKHALTYGARLLPTTPGPVKVGDELSAQFESDARNRWPAEDQLNKDLRGDLHAKQVQLDGLTMQLAALNTKLDAVLVALAAKAV